MSILLPTPTPSHLHTSPSHPIPNPISPQQGLEICICTRTKVVRDIVVHIMYRNTSRSRARITNFALRARECQTPTATRIDVYDSRRSGECSATGTFDGELPVRAVG